MIEIKNLTKTFKIENGDEIKALNNINFKVESGEILGILGKSGSGKTTLLRILRGVEHFDDGEIIIDGNKIEFNKDAYYSSQLKKLTAIHLQRSFGLWSETVLDNVIRKLYGVRFGDESMTDKEYAYKEFKDEAIDLIKLVGLGHKINHFAPVLSGGEKQRLIMARQLAKKPKVLLLDEPATMSCPRTKQEILDAVKNINQELGVTVIVVSHLPEIHEYLADRVILMENGDIIDEGEPKTIVKDFLKDLEPAEPLPIVKNQEKIITAENIYKKYVLIDGGEVLDLKDLNLDVNKGDLLCLIGPSGVGKTVFLRMIAGLEIPDAGNIKFKLDEDWIDMHLPSLSRMRVRNKLGFMHQEFALIHYSTIREQLASRLGIKGYEVVDYAKAKAEELGVGDKVLDSIYQLTDLSENEAKLQLEKLGLSSKIFEELFPSLPDTEVKKYAKPIFEALNLPLDILGRRSYELSGGQKVRAILALVMASKPDILILDEPFGDLDPITLRTVSNSLKNLTKEFNTTILMVSHHLDFVEELSSRAVLMDEGKIISDGEPSELCDDFIERSNAVYLMNRNKFN